MNLDKVRLTGVELAALVDPEGARAVENMLQQLLIVFLKRLGGRATIPAAEIDDTGNDLFCFTAHASNGRVDGFTFEIRKKN